MGRTVIVGDVHGCATELGRLLDQVRFASGDRLIFVGDLVARGPDSLGVLDIARQTGAIIVRGNHEHKLVAWYRARLAWLHGSRHDPRQGGGPGAGKEPIGKMHRDIARSLRPVDWTLLLTSPFRYDLPEHGALVVHAGVLPGVPLDEQDPLTMMRIRTVRVRGMGVRGTDVLWGRYWAGPPHVVFGHNAAPGLQLHPWATGLDTACVYGGRLTCMVLEPGQRIPRAFEARKRLLVSVPARRVHYDMNRAKKVA
jgi:hypothetical protein